MPSARDPAFHSTPATWTNPPRFWTTKSFDVARSLGVLKKNVPRGEVEGKVIRLYRFRIED